SVRMTVRIGVVLFPGSNRDIDAVNALEVAGAEPVVLWHDDASLDGVAGVLIPGRFVSREIRIAAERLDTPFTDGLDDRRALRMPVAHGEGAFYADEATLDALE